MGMLNRIKPTHDNFRQYAHEPLMRYLVGAALDGTTVTYGEGKAFLEKEAGFSTIFTPEMGHAVGPLMSRIQEFDRDAPLINTIMVSQSDRLPGEGAGPHMAVRFGMPFLAETNAPTNYPDEWEKYSLRAAGEVYRYSFDDWARLYESVFGKALSPQLVADDRQSRRQGSEKDGHQPGGGEGIHHKALRLWVQAHPGLVAKRYSRCRSETEVTLESMDRVDVVFYSDASIAVVEVKSRDSNEADYRRGVYQCIKYRAVQQAMEVRSEGSVEAILVTEINKLSGEVSALLKLHEITHVAVPEDRLP